MKSIVKDKNENGIQFPCLMKSINNGLIVLFDRMQCGTVVGNPSPKNIIGQYNVNWNMNSFEPFTGSITLSND